MPTVMAGTQKNILNLSGSEGLMPKEEMLEVNKQKASITIGIPREVSASEKRIALVPEAAGLLIQNGHRILIETNAGAGARFSDHEYAEVGCQVVYTPEEVYKADLLLKVSPPDPDEIEIMKERQVLISALNLTSQGKDYFRRLMNRKVTAVAFEYIKDTFGSYPVRRSVSEIVGNAAMQIAAHYLSDPEYGRGSMLGGFSGITPTEVVILGAGTVGGNAARVAMGMGAIVKIFDNSIYRLRRLQYQMNQRIFTSIIQPKVLEKALLTADVLICALHSPEGMAPCVVRDMMVKQMKANAVIIDVSIDQGGCVETSHATSHVNPVFKKYDVIHYCVPNIASGVPHTASYALSNFFAPVLLKIGEEGGIDQLIRTDRGICHGVYLYKGIVTKKHVSDLHDLPFQDIDLLLAAF
jgi:alanine dehydrogenase